MGEKDCPREGCVTVQLMAQELSGAVAQATECLKEISASHNGLKDTLNEMNTTLLLQNDRLKAGSKEFENIKNDIKELDSRIDCQDKKIAVLKDHDEQRGNPMTKKQGALLGAGSGGVVVVIAEAVKAVARAFTGQ